MRRGLSRLKLRIRSRYIVRWSLYRMDYESHRAEDPEDASEGEGDSWDLMAEALDQANRGGYFGVPDPAEDEDPEAEDEDRGRYKWIS